MADLTAAVRSAVSEALRTPDADVADAILDKISEGQIAIIGGEIIDLLTDLEEHLDGWTDPVTERMQRRVSDMLDQLGIPQIKGGRR